VQQFQAAGCQVFASARRLASMQSVKPLPGVHLVQLDVCSSDSIKAAVAEVVRTAGRVDVLVRMHLAPTLLADAAASERACWTEA
jgi:NADP-dependent 3-hydroxy acid dehydrogenase YdfG